MFGLFSKEPSPEEERREERMRLEHDLWVARQLREIADANMRAEDAYKRCPHCYRQFPGEK